MAVRKIHKFKYLVLSFLSINLLACDGSKSSLQLGEERMSENVAQVTAQMIAAIKEISLQRYPQGEVKRFNQSKSLGCFDATFSVVDNLPDELQQGVFVSGNRYPAKIRFANATEFDDTEKDFRGMSIKLFDVKQASLWGEDGQQDFLLNSHPSLFAANPQDFLDFIEATRDDQMWRYFINPAHFYSLRVIMNGRQKIDNPFLIRYWSTTPYRLGKNKDQAVKYSVQSCSNLQKDIEVKEHEHFLTETMTEHLNQQSACFDFMLQFQKDPESMPMENASVVWDESESAFIKVAKITISQQPYTLPSQVKACETMTFNPWQSSADHQPLGGINRVRKPVYSEISKFRAEQNDRG